MQTTTRSSQAHRWFNALAALSLATLALLASGAAWADPPGRVGRIAETVGTLWMFDAEQGEWSAARRNRPLTTGDRLSAERDARAELQIGSATVRLDGGTELEVTELNDDRVSLQLHRGALVLRLRNNESAREFGITTREGHFEPTRAGQYRVDQSDDGSFGGVIAGSLRFEARDSALEISAGQRAEFWNERGVTHYSWSALPSDRFGDWVAQQDRQDDRDARRRPYVSPEMTGAEDLDRYGDWDRHPEYGALWLPRRVEPGWAPYRYGHWAYVRPWGYTWVDDAPWGFAPFHYGRWVWWGGRWAWAPGQYVARPVYAPALVAWVGGPNVSIGINIGGGPAVGWVPLSPREIYRPTYNVTNIYVTNVNSPYRRWHPPIEPNPPVRTGPIMYTNQGVPGGVTVVSQNVLRERQPITSAVIAPVDSRTVQRWQTQPLQTGPAVQGPSRGNERRVQDNAPPPPAAPPRVVATPGGAVPVIPQAPGSGRTVVTPWGQAAPATNPALQAITRGRDADPQRPPARPPTVERGVPVTPSAGSLPQARDGRERRPESQDNGRSERRRGEAPQAVPPAPAVPGTQAVQPTQPVQGVRGVGPAPGAVPAPMSPVRAAPADPSVQRQRGPKDADEREERQPPGQERRRDQRQQQNQ